MPARKVPACILQPSEANASKHETANEDKVREVGAVTVVGEGAGPAARERATVCKKAEGRRIISMCASWLRVLWYAALSSSYIVLRRCSQLSLFATPNFLADTSENTTEHCVVNWGT